MRTLPFVLITASVILTGCNPNVELDSDSRVCRDKNNKRVDDSYCERRTSGSSWFFMPMGSHAPAVGSSFKSSHKGSYTPTKGIAYKSASPVYVSKPVSNTSSVSRGGFGSSSSASSGS